MGWFDDLKKKVSKGQDWVEEQGGVDGLKDKATQAADSGLDKAKGLTDKIPGDWDDKLVQKAEEIKDKVDGNNSK